VVYPLQFFFLEVGMPLMQSVGVSLRDTVMYLTRGRDFVWNIGLVDPCGDPQEFPAGELFFEFADGEQWFFEVDGGLASIKVESERADLVAARARWQLVFLPEGEPAGGTAWARGYVKVEK
jgi:hypothetical protein